jgi:hypothetical protein
MKALSAAVVAAIVGSIVLASVAEARGRTGSTRVGGYSSHGKGSHYVGGR